MWRYSLLGRAYDAISLERPLYRRPRVELLDGAGLRGGVDTWTGSCFGGHVHVAVGTCPAGSPARS